MPVSAPFQPACAAPITWALGSTNKVIPQSAPVTPSARPRVAVTSPSQRGPLVAEGRFHNQGIGRMDLIGHQEMGGLDAEMQSHAATVLGNGRGIVFRSDAHRSARQ